MVQVLTYPALHLKSALSRVIGNLGLSSSQDERDSSTHSHTPTRLPAHTVWRQLNSEPAFFLVGMPPAGITQMPVPPCTPPPPFLHALPLPPAQQPGALHIQRKKKPNPRGLFRGSTSFAKLEGKGMRRCSEPPPINVLSEEGSRALPSQTDQAGVIHKPPSTSAQAAAHSFPRCLLPPSGLHPDVQEAETPATTPVERREHCEGWGGGGVRKLASGSPRKQARPVPPASPLEGMLRDSWIWIQSR